MNSLKRRSLPPVLFGLLALLPSCASPERGRTRDDAPDSLVLIATSDFHSSFEKAEGMAAAIQSLRARYGERALYLDGGDLFQGSLEGNLSKGKAVVEYYNLLRADAVAMGNHELDYGTSAPDRSNVREGEDGLGNLRIRAREARFAWLSANFVKAGPKCNPAKTPLCNALGEPTFFSPRAVFKRAGLTACVIGATTPLTPTITNPRFLKGMRFSALEDVVPAEERFLKEREKCDFTVLVAHAGLVCADDGDCQKEDPKAEILSLLRAFPGKLDAVVAGHTHLKAQEIIGGTAVLEPGSHGRQVGVLRIHRRGPDGKPSRPPVFEPWVPVDEKAAAPEVTKLLAPYRENARLKRERVVGQISAPFPLAYDEEGPLGNLVVDAILAGGKRAGGAEIAITNPGGIRKPWAKAGTLRYGDVFATVPFDNALAIVELTGEELLRLIEISFSLRAGITPVAGLRIERVAVPPAERGPWDRDLDGDGKRETWERNLVARVTGPDGKPLDPKRRYKIATTDFLANGAEYHGKVYGKLPASRIRIYPDLFMRDMVEQEIARRKTLRPMDYYDPANPRVVTLPREAL